MFEEDPWMGGCWEVEVTDAEGNTSEPEERCGDDVPCPPEDGVVGCSDDGRGVVEACFEDGRCQVAVRTGDADDAAPDREAPGDPVGTGPLAGVEVFDHRTGGFVPASDAFADGTGDPDRLVSPLGEVLLRSRSVSQIDLGRRGLGVGSAA
jgi:hypothetical protein